ncbi:armadillo repeat-containing protein 6 homolog [Aricia agestis]|uniref:armadillo repeat-containing protein 6 homolog n=1 Tax=Aricia agestis TaxID=91739 RepID=UPI001C202E71|nr:armadillo repeat-containing protein 6 homolog [Aricia agestis]
MVRVITQETYDEVVKENIDEFDMSPEEAIKEAIAQFEAQGVDLSNIIKDLSLSSEDVHLVSAAVKKLKDICNEDSEEIITQLNVLMAECNKDIAHRIRAGKEGAYTLLIELLDRHFKGYVEGKKELERFVLQELNTLRALMDTQPDLLEPNGINLMKRMLDETQNQEILILTLKWISICCLKHEQNRQRIFATDIVSNFKVLLQIKGNTKLLSETLLAIRRFPLDDDIRVEFGKAHEHARDFAIQLLDSLTDILIENSAPSCAGEVMSTVSALLVRHELCATAARCCDALFALLADNYDNVVVTQQAVKLIIALAGNDDVKRQLVKSGIVPIVVSLLSRHTSNPTAAALILKCIAALSLREPEHSKQFLENGVAEAVVECLKVHQNNANVQKNGCWAIRNMVARCKEHNSKFHELGIQAILDKSYDMFGKEFGFDIKSALRDLECDVKLDEQWTGKGVEIDQ